MFNNGLDGPLLLYKNGSMQIFIALIYKPKNVRLCA